MRITPVMAAIALLLTSGASLAQAAEAGHEESAGKAFFEKRAAERAAVAPAKTMNHGGQGDAHAGNNPAKQGAARVRDSASMAGPHGRGGAASDSGAAPGSGGRESLLWLTDAPMQRDGKGGGRPGAGGRPAGAGMTGMGGMAEGGKDGVPTKRVWLRAGSNPKTARPATAEESALVQGPDGNTREIAAEPHGGPYNVKFPTPAQGSYNVYFSRRALAQDTLNVSLAKAEVMSASMRHGTSKDAAARLVVPRTESRMPAEIVRERKDKETPFTRLNYGDAIAFQILRGGQPVQNARVTFTSGQGWSNSVQSDEDGRAVFTLIRDYYPDDWDLFDKRHRKTYLVAASFSTPEAGEYQGGKYAATRYTATLSGAYYPGMADYESYSSGLMVGMAGLLFTGSSVWLYRRRRVKPYQEVRFDD